MYEEKVIAEGYRSVTWHALAFDAIWTLANGLNLTETMRKSKTSEEIRKETNCGNLTGELVPLNEFEYSNAFMGCIMKYNFHQTKFLGVTVRYIT